MHIVIPDDYQDCVRTLDCFQKLSQHQVTIFNDHSKDIDVLADRFRDAQAIVLTRERTALTAELLERLPELQLVSQIGKVAGHIDLDACRRLGVAVAQGSGSGAATAELTWALILASRRNLVAEATRLKQGLWQASLGQQLQGQRLGIWSYGRIGKQVAQYGKVFGMKVWVWGGAESTARAREDGIEVAPSREDFFSGSDVVSLHIRLTDQTRGVVGLTDLEKMKTTALLVNTSRSELIASGALETALKKGAPGFGAVDVYDTEPLTAHPLLDLPNVLCTPHLGYVERDNYENYFGIAFDNINNFASGQATNLV